MAHFIYFNLIFKASGVIFRKFILGYLFFMANNVTNKL